MKYRYVGAGSFLQGLPAADLDDEALSEEQKRALAEAVKIGLYEPIKPRPAPRAQPHKRDEADA